MYLNTSHVNVYRVFPIIQMVQHHNLNTSHVNVYQLAVKITYINMGNLNTSHVNVYRNGISTRTFYRRIFKYISC